MKEKKALLDKSFKLIGMVLALAFNTSVIASDFNNTLALANKGDVQSQIKIADNYRYVDLLDDADPDYSKALYWYTKAATQGSSEAQNNIAEMYQRGEGVSKNISQAIAWYEQAAMQGDGNAQFSLGQIYDASVVRYDSINQSPTKALEWYLKAAEKDRNHEINQKSNNRDAARNKVGDFYYYGNGVNQDYAKSFEWYQKAGKSSIGKVADMYYDGIGVTQDYSKALDSYLKAAQSYSHAYYPHYRNRLAIMYYDGIGTQQDYHEAFKWFNELAQIEDSYGELMVGFMYARGKGVRQDYIEAFKWYKKAAKQDDSTAQFAIGEMYLKGHGVRQSKTQAKEWFGKSCDNGDQDGCDMYKKLNK